MGYDALESKVATSKITFEHVNKVYKSKAGELCALRDINLEILENEFISFVGPSGCGKSTLLRILAGLDKQSSGKIIVSDRVLNGPGADRGMVFQSYTLFPWMTVEENICFGLKLKKVPPKKAREIAEKYMELIDMTQFRNSLPKELSGGMKQRVAIARALANSPEVILMDEPFGALDPETKASMQILIRKIWQLERSTIVFITHDIEEAVFLSQRIYIMSARPGRIITDLPIYLKYNRDLSLKETEEFLALKKEVSRILYSSSQGVVK